MTDQLYEISVAFSDGSIATSTGVTLEFNPVGVHIGNPDGSQEYVPFANVHIFSYKPFDDDA